MSASKLPQRRRGCCCSLCRQPRQSAHVAPKPQYHNSIACNLQQRYCPQLAQCLCRRPARAAGQPPCGNAACSMTAFQAIAVSHGGGASDLAPAKCHYQGVFIAGHQPLWLVAHRGGYTCTTTSSSHLRTLAAPQDTSLYTIEHSAMPTGSALDRVQ